MVVVVVVDQRKGFEGGTPPDAWGLSGSARVQSPENDRSINSRILRIHKFPNSTDP